MAARPRVVIGEDDVIFREGMDRLLTEAGFEVVAQAGDAEDLLRKGVAHRPDLVIADINMPPGRDDDGLRAALEVRARHPGTGVLILSQYYDVRYTTKLVAEGADGIGYLLKERVGDVESFVQAAERVAEGRSAVDPEVIARLFRQRHPDDSFEKLTPRERDVLAVMAEGKSNRGIAAALFISEAAVEKHTNNIFRKLGLGSAGDEHRRVHAVLTYLRNS
jgi:DNA-binding NarL/FixJ family response regulator